MSKLTQFSNFTRSSAGLEKTLRLIQAVTQIAADVTGDRTVAKQWSVAKRELALTRRFFRFFNFIDCFDRVAGLLGTGSGSGEEGVLTLLIELARWSCLGGYFLLEDLTILHAMNIPPSTWTWERPVLEEAYKLWFYALTLSVLGAVWSLLFVSASTSNNISSGKGRKGAGKKGSKGGNNNHKALRRKTLLKRIVVDGCDLLIPGAFLGWVQVGDLGVGVAMVVSTLVAGGDVWGSVNS